ncbi:MAG: EI24 domain-containing protein [Rhodospirillaceae bacterium]|nr:EI24 domain-containing protein [Rhodospirillaceae bacterium]
MIQAFTAAMAMLRDPRIVGLAVRSIVFTVVVYAVLFAGLAWALSATTLAHLPWLDTVLDLGVGVAAAIMAWLMFPGVVSAVMALFLERVAAAVEARHYPQAGAPRAVPLMESLRLSARLLAYTVTLNLICLPLYVVLLFAPPLNLLLFYAINGKLLGREYFETVALRHADGTAVNDLRARHSGTLWMAGAITTALLTIPILNLVAPVIGIAAMVHLFHGRLFSRTSSFSRN